MSLGRNKMNSITLMDAYAIENLRSYGYTNEEILSKVKDKDIDEFKKVKENLDFTLLIDMEESVGLKTLLEDGYQVKFLTFNGLKNLIKLKFGKLAEEDYQVDEFTLSSLKLDEGQASELKKALSQNWQMKEEDGSYKVEPVK